MLTSLHIQNFKAWKNTGEIRLAPLTIIFGANSAGKSSLGHLMLALKQTVLSADRKRPLQLGDENSLVELGTFAECIHNHDLAQTLGFGFGWKLPHQLDVHDPVGHNSYHADELRLAVSMRADKQEQPRVQALDYAASLHRKLAFAIAYRRSTNNSFELHSDQYRFVRNSGKSSPLDEPDKFYRISDQSRAQFQNAEFLSDLALQTEAVLDSIHHLGPMRETPRRLYSWSGETPLSVGQKGEYTIAAILAATAQQRMLSRGPHKHQQPFDQFIAQWLQELGVIENFSVQPLAKGRKEYEVLVRTHGSNSDVKITDVGFGVSQVLPALTQAFYCPPNSTLWVEQPEIHLHPQIQAELADVYISAIKARENGMDRNVQLIVESHSEHFLNRLQRRVAEGELAPEAVAVYFCRRTGASTELDPLRLNELGEIENWPENFFGNEMVDIAARTLAALARKKARREQQQP